MNIHVYQHVYNCVPGVLFVDLYSRDRVMGFDVLWGHLCPMDISLDYDYRRQSLFYEKGRMTLGFFSIVLYW